MFIKSIFDVTLILIFLPFQTFQDDIGSDISAEVNDILHRNYRHNTNKIDNDPFFLSSYQSTYDPISELSFINTEPDFVYDADHISPYQVDVPEYRNKNKLPKKLDALRRGPRRAIDKDPFFASYNPYFDERFNSGEKTHENLEVDSSANVNGNKKRKKGKKGKKKKGKPKRKPGEMNKRQVKDNDDESDEIDYKYSIDFEPSDEYARIKQISDKQRADLKQNPENCKVYHSYEGQTCYECLDPNTGDTSESCSYDDDPAPAKYAYESSQNYNSKDDVPKDEDFDEAQYSDEVETTTVRVRRPHKRPKKSDKSRSVSPTSRGTKRFESLKESTKEKIKPQDTDYYYDDEENDADTYYDTSYDAEILEPYKHSFYFSAPHKTHEEIKMTPDSYTPVYDAKSDVDIALDDFKKRDWSSCKKTQKGDLTCYQCTDKNGVNHEDCMFVQESRPTSVRVIYKGPKRLHTTTPMLTNSPETTTPLTTILNTPIPKTTSQINFLKVAPLVPKPNRQKTKKIVIVKRKKPANDQKNGKDDDRVIEKRTIKRRIKVTLKGNATMPNQLLEDKMKDFIL